MKRLGLFFFIVFFNSASHGAQDPLSEEERLAWRNVGVDIKKELLASLVIKIRPPEYQEYEESDTPVVRNPFPFVENPSLLFVHPSQVHPVGSALPPNLMLKRATEVLPESPSYGHYIWLCHQFGSGWGGINLLSTPSDGEQLIGFQGLEKSFMVRIACSKIYSLVSVFFSNS
jgi:hypothetical protein